jgi:hypothetical protein
VAAQVASHTAARRWVQARQDYLAARERLGADPPESLEVPDVPSASWIPDPPCPSHSPRPLRRAVQ